VQSRRAPAARDGLDETEGSSDTRGWRDAFAYDRVPFLRLIAARIAGEAVNVMTAVVGVDAIKVSPEPGVTTI
jgi:hypothetical protein